MKKIIFITLASFLVACHTTKPEKVIVTTETVNTPTEAELAESNRKKNLFEQHCMSCHALAKPNSETEKEWIKIVPRMVSMINKKGVLVDEKTEGDILSYLIANCKK